MGEELSLILRLRDYYPSLTKTDKKIADVVLDKGDEIIYNSITEFAEECGVSETSIVRLCRKIGLSGYQEFKLLLARDRVMPEENLYETVSADDDLTTMAKKVSEENIQAINNTMRVISMEELDKAVEAIIKARNIEIYGVGASGYTALDIMHRFKRIGLQANAYVDPHVQSMTASLLDQNDVVLGVSFTGSTRDTVDAVKMAKKCGATVICITNHGKSPIVNHADVVLLSSVRETPLQSGGLSSKIAHLHIIDLLYTGVTMRIKERALENINKTAGAVLNKLY